MKTGCYQPFFVKDGNGKQVLVPCGKCPKCKARRVSAWSFRLMQEDKKSNSSHFITLTYADENLPITRNGYRSLYRRDLQLFFKRLRKAQKGRVTKNAIKYFAVGEYGGKIGRPHYHIILFNADIALIQKAWCTYRVVNSEGSIKARIIESNGRIKEERKKVRRYDMGHIHYGDKRGVNGASIGYCLKYILKPKNNGGCPDDDSQKEFTLMSKGLGLSYIDGNIMRWHLADLANRMYVNVEGGRKASMPRYYKNIIYSKREREYVAEVSRNKFAEDILNDLFRLYKNDADYVGSYQKIKRNKEEKMKGDYRRQQLLKNKNQKVCYQ